MSNLIQKHLRGGKLIWRISQNFESLNKRMIAKYNLSLENYLVLIYTTRVTRPRENRQH